MYSGLWDCMLVSPVGFRVAYRERMLLVRYNLTISTSTTTGPSLLGCIETQDQNATAPLQDQVS